MGQHFQITPHMLLCVRCNNLEAAPPEEDIVSANLLCNKFPVLTKNKKRQQRAATKQKQRAKQLQPFFTCPKNIVRENSPPFFVFMFFGERHLSLSLVLVGQLDFVGYHYALAVGNISFYTILNGRSKDPGILHSKPFLEHFIGITSNISTKHCYLITGYMFFLMVLPFSVTDSRLCNSFD